MERGGGRTLARKSISYFLWSPLLTALHIACFLQVLSRDSVTVSVDAVVYYRVSNPTMATNNIEDYRSVAKVSVKASSSSESPFLRLFGLLDHATAIKETRKIGLTDLLYTVQKLKKKRAKKGKP